MKMFDKAIIRGRKIEVEIAKFEKGERKRDSQTTHSRGRHHKQFWKRKEQREGSKMGDGYARQTHELTLWKKEIKGEVNVEFEDWL